MYIALRFIGVFLVALLSSGVAIAQEERVLKGSLENHKTGEKLPFASVTLQEALLGTITNDQGEFEVKIPVGAESDTLVISYIGYESQKLAVSSLQSPVTIKLKSSAFNLAEVIIRPKPPIYYIKQAVKNLADNYPGDPFMTEAYFSEKVRENGKFLEHNEAVFQTYYPAFLDTVKNQNQLLLYRQTEELHEMEFMREKIEKEMAKEKRKLQRKAKKDPEAAEELAKFEKEEEEGIDLAGILGGPNLVLELARMNGREAYLDSNNYEKIDYTFGQPTTYGGKKVMVIDFQTRKRIEQFHVGGTIFLDEENMAIVAVKFKGEFKIPTFVRPILFVMGLSIKNPDLDMAVNYRELNGKWYPLNVRSTMSIDVEKRHWFSENEESTFKFNQVFSVNKIKLEESNPIVKEKLYNPSKGYEEQVHNDLNLRWEQVNVLR